MNRKVKIAIFISGPFRYCNNVVKQINSFLSRESVDYGIFIHLWSVEVGKKSRGIDIDLKSIESMGNVKRVFVEEPLSESVVIDDIKKEIGRFSYRSSDFIGASSINNLFGMFKAINTLYDLLKKESDWDKYTHILRLRTDISFNTSLLPKKIEDGVVYISRNPLIEADSISDHTMLFEKEFFKDIWGRDNGFIKEFKESYYNPEILLTNRFEKKHIKSCFLWKRFIDYHVVYGKGKESYAEKILGVSGDQIFEKKYKFIDMIYLKIIYQMKSLKKYIFSLLIFSK